MNLRITDWQWIAATSLSFFVCLTSALAQTTEVEPPTSEEAATEEKPPVMQEFPAYDGRMQIEAPATWKLVKPRNNLIEVEISIPPADADEASEDETANEKDVPHGRLTMMSAGGDVDANIRRWVGQFRLGRDADGKDAMKREELKIEGAVIHTLDIAGTYFDSPRGPFGPKIERPDYRMLGAIIEVEDAGKFFVKFYGPAKLVERNHKAFSQMLKGIKFTSDDTDSDTGEEKSDRE